MTVTFDFVTITDDGTQIHGAACETCDQLRVAMTDAADHGITSDAYETASDTYFDHVDVCDDQRWQVNLSNTNAVSVLSRLGLPADYAGTVDPDEMLGRAMVANIGRDDSGVADHVEGNYVDCGVPAGYYDDRLACLAALAAEAKRRGALVGWC